MTRTTRSHIFFALVLCFVLGAPLVVMWAKGYRFDPQKRAVVRVGAIFVKTNGVEADISIGGLSRKRIKPSFFSSSVLVKNLLPGTYPVRVSKDGYFAWEKTLLVSPLQVAKATHALLVPVLPEIRFMATTTAQYILPSPRAGSAYLVDIAGKRITLAILELARPDRPESIQSVELTRQPLSRLRSVLPSAGGGYILLGFSNNDYLIWRTGLKRATMFDDYIETISQGTLPYPVRLMWHPSLEGRLLGVMADGRLYGFDLSENTYERIKAEPIASAEETRAMLLTVTGTVLRPAGEALETLDKVMPPAFSAADTLSSDLLSLEPRSYAFRSANGDLWILGKDILPLRIARKAVRMTPNTERTRLAVFTQDRILSVFFVQETLGDVRIPGRTVLGLGLVDADLQNIHWINDDWYLALTTPNRIELVEIDSRSPINRFSYTIANAGTVLRPSDDNLIYLSRNAILGVRVGMP